MMLLIDDDRGDDDGTTNEEGPVALYVQSMYTFYKPIGFLPPFPVIIRHGESPRRTKPLRTGSSSNRSSMADERDQPSSLVGGLSMSSWGLCNFANRCFNLASHGRNGQVENGKHILGPPRPFPEHSGRFRPQSRLWRAACDGPTVVVGLGGLDRWRNGNGVGNPPKVAWTNRAMAAHGKLRCSDRI